MDSDLLLVIGIVLGVLTVPALFSALAEGRPPRSGAIVALISGVLIVVALNGKPGGYRITDIPNAFYAVWGRYIQ